MDIKQVENCHEAIKVLNSKFLFEDFYKPLELAINADGDIEVKYYDTIIETFCSIDDKSLSIEEFEFNIAQEILNVSSNNIQFLSEYALTSKYEHHGKEVTANTFAIGIHRNMCLCFKCKNFKPNTDENCPIAKAIYDNTVKYNLVTPVLECPKFK